jgi:hypothetical protein
MNTKPKLLTASQRRNLVEAIGLARNIRSAAAKVKPPAQKVDKLPGFSQMQLKAAIDKITKTRQEAEVIRKQYETVLKQLKDLDKSEADGVEQLKAAAKAMGVTEGACVETEKALLEWTAFLRDSAPGIEQMIAKSDDPEVIKKGLKAGDFFGKIGAELGVEIAEKVEALYKATKESLVVTNVIVTPFKIVAKTGSTHPVVLKKAGLGDVVLAVKGWLAGKKDSAMQHLIQFGGTLKEWVKGFKDRSTVAVKAKDDLKSALADARKEIEAFEKNFDKAMA